MMRVTRTRRFRRKTLFITLLIVLVVANVIAAGMYIFYKATDYEHVTLDLSDEELGISSANTEESTDTTLQTPQTPTEQDVAAADSAKWDDKIVNIALFGVDRRDTKDVGRSDSMMVLTIDFKHHKIKLSSLMRDMEVPIDGHGRSKLNHAYAYGGPTLSIKTINEYFGTDIRDYVTVDFFTLEKIIDAIGGVPIEVKENEIDMINKYMDETATIQKKTPVYLKEGGLQTLNGMQAVSYARIRYVGNGDFERTERQRKVLSAMIDKAKEQGLSEVPSMLMKITPYIETTLSRSDVLSLAYKYFTEGSMALEQERFPIDGSWEAGRGSGGAWIMEVDDKQIRNQVQQYIFNDVDPNKSNEKEG